MSPTCFRVNIETENDTGRVISVYFYIRKGKVHATKEYARGKAFADYNAHGELLGIEMLAPCTAKVLDRIAKRKPERQFVQSHVPQGMLVPV